jgi:uncharacterized protein YodC (DUF2158 family)
MAALKTFKSFKPGEVVMLKSGGMPMTVEHGTNHEGEVECMWFEGYNATRFTFPANALDVTALRFDPAKGTIG